WGFFSPRYAESAIPLINGSIYQYVPSQASALSNCRVASCEVPGNNWCRRCFAPGDIVARILVTGASGFVGRALVDELANAGHAVRAAMRQPADGFPRSVEGVAVADLTRPVGWRPLLRDVETVVHLAGIAHAESRIAEQAYNRVNRLATAELANAARAHGIGHLIFMSSIRAQSGAASREPLRETDTPRPTDAYGR